ncbi:MAG: multiheme c-type cytochrome [Sandaracinus sp.]
MRCAWRRGPGLATAAALGLAWLAIGGGAGARAQRAPSADIAARAIDPARCGECHAEEAATHASSAHAAAAVDPIFLAEYAPRPDPACVRCHAPLAPEGAAIDAPLARIGVGCAACHVRGGEVLSAGAPSGRAPHPSRREPALSRAEGCAGCHQFAFGLPSDGSAPHFDPAEVQQDTLAEWREAGAPRCQRCHMRGEGRGHAFGGLGDAALVRGALHLRARARREGPQIAFDLRLTAARVGHAVPTGDVFRRLRITARTERATASAELRRYFAPTAEGGGLLVREVDDTRVAPGQPRTVRLVLADSEASAIAWRVELLRLDPDVARARGLEDGAITILVAEGSSEVRRPRGPSP